MQIAIALLAHKNVGQLNLLIDSMSDPAVSFYVHVDKKGDLKRSEIKGANVYVVPKEESMEIRWGGYDMVAATLLLLKKIKSSKKKFDFIWLMSGQDFPLQPIKSILDNLEHHLGEDYIRILPDDEAYNGGYCKRNELYYPSWMVSNNTFVKMIKHTYWLVTGGKKRTWKFARRKSPIQEFYYGSQWWLLSNDSIETMLTYLESHPSFEAYFKNSLVPDECFFQTLYKSALPDKKANDSVCYVNWKGSKNSPEILTSRDFDMLDNLDRGYFVARKFDLTIDKDIVTKLSNRNSK